MSNEHPRLEYGEYGMFLRDYFAARAMQGLIGRAWGDALGKVPDNVFSIWAESAYKVADEMLKARQPDAAHGSSETK